MDFELYCDESRSEIFSTTGFNPSRFLLIGGLWLPADKREYYKREIKNIRELENTHGEIKWRSVAPSKLSFYLRLIDFFFLMGDQLRFRCIVVERDKVDLVKYHQSDHELGFYKFYYQLIHHWIFDFNRYSIFLDYKKNKAKDRLHTLKKVLKNANLTSEILCVQALPSKESVLIQLADLLIGAVGYKFHSHLESAAKNSVITKIEDYLKHPIQKTKLVEAKFNVFQINLGGGW